MIVDPNVKAREIAHPPTTTLVGAHCRRNLTQEGTMTSCGQYLLSPKVFEVQESQLAKPGADEVQIALRSTTICGSDLHYYAHARNGSIKLKEPLCLGHETAGEVVDVGISVVNLQAGDKVALECGVPCSQCELCLAQRYNLCPELRFRGSGAAFPHFQGSLQVKVNHPARWVHK